MFDFFKKKKSPAPVDKVNSFGEPLDKLVDGELPWGWVVAYSDFTDRIKKEYSYFWQAWIDARKDEPKKEISALKSLLQYMDDVQNMCNQKGECFGFWCKRFLIGNQKERCSERIADLEKNMDAHIQKYEERLKLQAYRAEVEAYEATLTDKMMFDTIRQHEGILQKDFYKLFDSPYAKDAVSEKLYFMAKEGKIERIKSGNSYILKLKD